MRELLRMEWGSRGGDFYWGRWVRGRWLSIEGCLLIQERELLYCELLVFDI